MPARPGCKGLSSEPTPPDDWVSPRARGAFGRASASTLQSGGAVRLRDVVAFSPRFDWVQVTLIPIGGGMSPCDTILILSGKSHTGSRAEACYLNATGHRAAGPVPSGDSHRLSCLTAAHKALHRSDETVGPPLEMVEWLTL